ncbi:RNA polymerase factor sigma-54 [Desulfococcaceae bacterium HSG7]|nr:RNA polymerase factor sigma-54 [Desulfococcaceae bacterium HSG7]
MELQLNLKLSQQLVMTPQLRMAIKLLQLSRIELIETIRLEMEANPALEDIAEIVTDDILEEPEDIVPEDETRLKEVTIDEKFSDDVDWNNYLDEYNSAGKVYFESEKRDSYNFETFVASKGTLEEHLLWQLLMISPTSEDEEIGSVIIASLNNEGYLDISNNELAALCNTTPEKIDQVVTLLQTFDPIGVCAHNIIECLLIQMRYFGIDNPIITKIVSEHLNHLENKNYHAVANDLMVGVDTIVEAVEVIKRLEPRPGYKWDDEEPRYINPDIFVYKLDDELVIIVNDDGMPKLRVNPYYKNSVKNDSKLPHDAKEYVQEKLKSASWLIRSIRQRNQTLYNVMASIIKFQGEFFEKGPGHLKPLVLRNVAEDIDMHESTISRVTNNKYVHTPQGIFELRYFFNASIRRDNGDAMSAASVREKIRAIISNENPYKPYSDDKISKLLKKEQINIARRTVAKYREKLGVLSSSKRKIFSET